MEPAIYIYIKRGRERERERERERMTENERERERERDTSACVPVTAVLRCAGRLPRSHMCKRRGTLGRNAAPTAWHGVARRRATLHAMDANYVAASGTGMPRA